MPDAYRELGGLHIVDAQELSRQASLAQAKAIYDGGGGLIADGAPASGASSSA